MKKRDYIIITSILIAVFFVVITYKFYPKSKVVQTALIIKDTVIKPKKEELLGRAEISFAGGTEARAKNIELGISKINGTVVAPGEEFSFKKTLGPVTEDDGYDEAKVFLNGEVIKGLGGGLCQVSTTLFQSLVHSGLPITERHNHSFTVSYYDVGLDATFSDPGPDLKFLNDTGNPITIKGSVKDNSAVFEIYGVKDGRVASTSEPVISDTMDFPPTKYVATTTRAKSEPECINTPQIGYTAKVMYSIEYPTGTTTTQVFDSIYKPLQRVCYVDVLDLAGTTTSTTNKGI